MAWTFGTKLGSGGYGNVFAASHEELEGDYAAKFLDDAALSNEEAVARFKREVKIQSGLTHPHIVDIVDSDVDAARPYFVMPKADCSLEERIGVGIGEEEIDEIFRAVLSAVAYAHQNGVIHRDMKPLNVLMYGDIPRVSDFGLGKNLASDSATLTRTTALVGTFIYMAPEQMTNPKGADQRCDIYALGRMLQQLVTAKLPLPGLVVDIPRKYRYLIERCCEQQPSERYQSVEALLEAFDQVVRGVERPEIPDEEATRLISAWQDELFDDEPILRDLHALFERHADDVAFFYERFPRLPEPLLVDYVEKIPRGFERMLRAYDEHVSGGLNFSYCDVVADFYAKLWRMIEDVTIRKLLLTRLILMGAWHNRFHVGNVVAALVQGVDDQSEAMMIADVLTNYPEEARWVVAYIDKQSVPTAIGVALDNAASDDRDAPADPDDLPF